MAEEIKIEQTNNKGILNEFSELMSGGVASVNKTSLDQFMAVLELEDYKFDKIYPSIKQGIEEGFNDDIVRTDLLNAMKHIPIVDIEAEEKAIREFIEEIKSNDELSDNKKDMLVMILEKGILTSMDIYNNPREKITVQIEKLNPNAIIPTYAHPTDAGADVSAVEITVVPAGKTVLVHTGLKLAIPKGYEVQVRPRSGLSLKTGLRVANAPGTIDSSYRGELGIIITNTSSESYTIAAGDKIAQILIAPTPMMDFVETTISDTTDRGEGGFGSSDA